MVSITPPVLARTSLFQNRITFPALAFQPERSSHIGLIVRVLTAVQFDNQPVLRADEIDDVLADWVLPAELVPQQAPIAQCRPHAPLGIGG
jgi:hypothetical protein